MSENTTTAKTFAERAATEPTELHKNFAAWIKAQTGYDADLKTVQIVCAMRMDFQKSDENQNALKDRKANAAKKAEEAKAKKLAKLEAELAKLKGEEAAAEDAPKPEEPTEAPKADAADEGEAKAEIAPETPTEDASEVKADDKPKPVRRTRRTTTAKK